MKLSIVVEEAKVSICLDFANTAAWHASEQPVERLHSYSDLVAWAEEKGLVAADRAQRLNELAGQRPHQAQETLKQAIDIREAIYHIFSAYAHARQVESSDLALINATLSATLAKAQVSAADDAFEWRWIDDETALDCMLWPVVRAAADLLTSTKLLARVGQCADDQGCGYLFLDVSKNHSRRWCDINDCGNRAKQRRHYRRTRGLP